MSEESSTYLTAATEPKSSIGASLGAASTPKGEAQVEAKIYFHNDSPEALARAISDCQTAFTEMRAWAAAGRVVGS